MMEHQRRWQESLRRATIVLGVLDPAGLGPGELDGAPPDEYSPEASKLMKRLAVFEELSPDDVVEVFRDQFSAPDILDAPTAEEIAERLTAIHWELNPQR